MAADLNGDGVPDLAVAGTRGGVGPEDDVSVLLANGDGTFQNSGNYACVRFVSSIVAVDFNGDGKLDLVVGSSFGDSLSLSVLIGNGDGTLQSHRDYSAGFAPISVAAGDFNRDGKLDLVAANDQDNNVAVLLGTGDGTFQPRSDYTAGNSSQGITAADLNGDGKLDLVTADCGGNTVSVLLGNTDGTFQGRSTYGAGACPVAVATGDFNSDGGSDLVVANSGDNTISVLLGNSNGTFQPPTNYALLVAPTAIMVADFNSDGKPDVAVLNDGLVSIFLGNGNGSFQARIDSSNGVASGTSLAVGDLNGDGIPDLAITDPSFSGTLSVLLGDGDGTFRSASPRTYTLPFSPNSVAVGDFNRDGKLDLAVSQGTSQGTVSILLGFGDGSFQAPVQFQTNHSPGSVAAADFDGDGILDLAVGGSSTSILLGNGDGTFQTHMDHVGGAYALTTGDFDGDGRMDLAAATLSSFVSVFLNKPAANPASRPPSITSISPTSGTQGQTISNFTVNGTNFDPAAVLSFSSSGITVNSYVSRTTTQIVASITIASTAGTGPYDVTVTNPDSQHATLPGGFSVTVPPTGTINVTTNTPSATFTLTGPATLSGTGTSATFSNAPVGMYTITFGAVAGDITPSQQTQTLTSGGTLTFTGTYNPVPPPPPPSITSISPLSGNQGQTVIVTVTGSSFLPGATLYFVGVAQTLTSQVTSVSTDSTSATASVVIPADAALEPKNLVATNIGSRPSQPLSNAFRIFAREFQIFAGPASEPSLAVDTLNPLHAVVGFIDASRNPQPQTCGWKETIDGGKTWNPNSAAGPAGAFPLPPPFQGPAGDPWVRYSPNGDLLYSCIGVKQFTLGGLVLTQTRSIFVAISPNTRNAGGLAGKLALGKQPVTTVSCTTGLPCAVLDHPAITTFGNKGGFRVLACWAEFSSGTSVVKTSVSTDGNTWSQPKLLSQSGRLCTVGGNSTQAAVTWFDDIANGLFWATSTDGTHWSQPNPLDTAGDLVYGSTTNKVLAGPYALVISGSAALRGVYQVRDGHISKVFLRDLAAGSQRRSLGVEQVEKFLPGAGACGQVAGSYQATTVGITSGSAPFRYTGWSTTDSSSPLFISGADLGGSNGFPSPTLPKINDYTGADCSSDFGWLAWTDLRLGIPGKPQIWGTRFPLK